MERIKKKKGAEVCKDSQCPIHGTLAARGRIFSGLIMKKFPRRIAIEVERTVYNRKYERYAKKKTRLHARLPACMKDIEEGDYAQIRECRPLSKIIHFVMIKKLRAKEKK